MTVNVWANAKDVPGAVCADARLRDRSRWTRPTTNSDQFYGQAGWDIGVNFMHIGDLAIKLRTLNIAEGWSARSRPIQCGEIQRLAIHAHGTTGVIYINGQEEGVQDKSLKLTAETIAIHQGHLHQIGLMTPDNPANPAVILFVGCLAAGGPAGTALLTGLSRLWPNRKVVAYATLGYAPGARMLREGAHCTEPGMRDTNENDPGKANRKEMLYWEDLKTWPWATEKSPRAKVALNQTIIHGAQW